MSLAGRAFLSTRYLGRGGGTSIAAAIHAVSKHVAGRSIVVRCGSRQRSLRPHIRGRITGDGERAHFPTCQGSCKPGHPYQQSSRNAIFPLSVVGDPGSSDLGGIASPDSSRIENVNIPHTAHGVAGISRFRRIMALQGKTPKAIRPRNASPLQPHCMIPYLGWGTRTSTEDSPQVMR